MIEIQRDITRHYIIAKAGIHLKKVMCIWWNWKGVIYCELLPSNETINSTKYCSQLAKLKKAIDEKRRVGQ